MNRDFVYDHQDRSSSAWTRAGSTLNKWLWGALCCGVPGIPCYFCTCCEKSEDDRDRPRKEPVQQSEYLDLTGLTPLVAENLPQKCFPPSAVPYPSCKGSPRPLYPVQTLKGVPQNLVENILKKRSLINKAFHFVSYSLPDSVACNLAIKGVICVVFIYVFKNQRSLRFTSKVNMSALIIAVCALLSVVLAEQPKELKAVAFLTEPYRRNEINGNLTFTQLDANKVRVEGVIVGLPAGQYGFHIHEKGDLSGGCATAGPHFNPEKKQHGHPNDENRHVGDLGNVVFDENAVARIDFVDSKLSLYGPHSILGRAVVLHESDDDYGRTDHPDSKTTGNAGGRAACGVVGLVDPVYGWETSAASSVTISTMIAAITITLSFLY
ncbi:unnamed protein product [Leptosia nina]|uniref:Superoxide dismutase [Cu-Zn] n=1 Tax=Leptosia nina TaxID=320188 RepID=A0AAV1JT68_9NEOP